MSELGLNLRSPTFQAGSFTHCIICVPARNQVYPIILTDSLITLAVQLSGHILLLRLPEYGIGGKMYNSIKNMYDDSKSSIL